MDDIHDQIAALRQQVSELAGACDFTMIVAMTALNALRREGKITDDEVQAIVEAGSRAQRTGQG